MSDVTQILNQMELGDSSAADQLLPLVYDQLRQLASAKLANEKPGQTLQATALVHEAYLRVVGNGDSHTVWNGRKHFYAVAAEAMRRILVDAARRKRTIKHGGDLQRIDFLDDISAPNEDVDLIALDDLLDTLAREDLRKSELVKLRYFAGLTSREAAAVLGISKSTADADWAYAKAWLKVRLGD